MTDYLTSYPVHVLQDGIFKVYEIEPDYFKMLIKRDIRLDKLKVNLSNSLREHVEKLVGTTFTIIQLTDNIEQLDDGDRLLVVRPNYRYPVNGNNTGYTYYLVKFEPA